MDFISISNNPNVFCLPNPIFRTFGRPKLKQFFPMYRLQLMFAFLAFSVFAEAQQLPLFTQYRDNITVINPAAVNSSYWLYDQNLSFGASYRNQWVGLKNSPTTATLRGDYLMDNGNTFSLLTGGHLIHDVTGPTGFSGLYGKVGGVISGDPYYSGISVALNFGLVQYRVDASEIIYRDEGDAIGAENHTQFFPDVGFGLFAYTQLNGGIFDDDYLYGGVSVPQVIGLELAFEGADGEFITQRIQHFYGVLGLYKFLRDDSFVEPSIWIRYAPNAPVSADFNLRYQMQNNFWIGAGGSLGGFAHTEFGFILGDNVGFVNTMKIGYSFDYSFSSYGPFAGGTHEINVSYSLENN